MDGIGRCVQDELAGPTHSLEMMFSLKSKRLEATDDPWVGNVDSDRKLVLSACEGPETLLLRVAILCHLVQYHNQSQVSSDFIGCSVTASQLKNLNYAAFWLSG